MLPVFPCFFLLFLGGLGIMGIQDKSPHGENNLHCSSIIKYRHQFTCFGLTHFNTSTQTSFKNLIILKRLYRIYNLCRRHFATQAITICVRTVFCCRRRSMCNPITFFCEKQFKTSSFVVICSL